MNLFFDKAKYPFECMGMRCFEDRNECITCGATVEQGIIPISQHWCKCAGKDQFDAIMKIKDMPLKIEDKMDLVKSVFNINR